MKILHIADIQIEVRNSAQRYDEFQFILNQIQGVIEDTPDLDTLVIAGDISEYWNMNDIERELFISFIHSLSSTLEIVIIPGNHDICQRGVQSRYITNGVEETVPTALDTMCKNFPSNVIYAPKSGFYQSKIKPDFYYCCWSQIHKFETSPTGTYNPLMSCDVPSDCKDYVMVFHDAIRNARGFDGNVIRGCQNKDNVIEDLCEKRPPLMIIAGDIHQHYVTDINGIPFTYCGSPCARDFGEGDYYCNFKLIQAGGAEHGYNIIEITSECCNIVWGPLKQYHSYITFDLDGETLSESDINKIPQYSTPTNHVKVRVTNSYNKCVEYFDMIIDRIRERIPAAQIEFVQRKIVDEDIVGDSIEVNRLISLETIRSVGKDYITKAVLKSRNIPKEDKNETIDNIYNIFIQELEKFSVNKLLVDIEPYRLRLSNFMAIGECDIHFEDGLTKITGSNGTGKTTVYNALKFAWTGFIYPSQNSNKKKENLLMVFNDHRPLVDEVVIDLDEYVNGELLHISKTITRKWENGTTLEQKTSSSWIDYCTMPSIDVRVEYQDKLYTGSEAEDLIYELHGSLLQILRTMFTNAPSLYEIINTSTNALNSEILYNLGLNFFETMYDAYNELKDSKLEGMSKPMYSVDELKSQIEEHTSSIEELEAKNSELNRTILDKEKEIVSIEADIVSKSNTLKQVEDESALLVASRENKLSISKLEKDIEDSHVSLAADKARYTKSEATLKLEQNELKDKRIEVTKLISELNEAISSQKDNINATNEDIRTRQQAIIDAERDRVNTIKDEIGVLKIKRQKLETDKEKALSTVATEHNDTIHDINQRVSSNNSAINNANNAIANAEEKVERYSLELSTIENETVCTRCGQIHTAESRKKVFGDIEAIKSQIDEQKSIIFENEELLKTLHSKETEYESERNSANHLKTEKCIEINCKFKADDEDIAKQIKAKLGMLDEIKSSLRSRIDEDTQLKSYQTHLEECEKSIERANLRIASNNELLSTIDKHIEDIQEVIDTVSKFSYRESAIKTKETLIQEYYSKRTDLETRIQKLNEAKEFNNTVKTEIESLTSKKNAIEDEIKEATNSKNANNSEIEVNRYKIDIANKSIKAWKEYKILTTSLKIYKQIIGKNGLPQYIFSLILENLNMSLNSMLEGLPFVLYFSNDGELKMVDTRSKTERSVLHTSGMESTFLGLALIYVLKSKNVSKKTNILFIDEVSGQLNSGENLSYEALNFQELFKQLLQKMKDTFKICVIDHVIENLDEDHRYEVVPDTDGNQVIKIK